jgi:hypothetical protein
MTDPIRDMVRPAAADARDTRSHRILYGAAILCVLGILALGALYLSSYLHDRDVQGQLAGDVQVLDEQVRSMGGTPRATVPEGIPGAAGAVGRQGERGPTGDAGPSGPAGPTGPTGPTGPGGTPGQSGADGGAGQAGAAGASGQPGPTGPSGAPGPSGASGAPGPSGPAGADGQPPAGWTWTDRLGTTYTCTRDASSPPSAPTYSCTATKGVLP